MAEQKAHGAFPIIAGGKQIMLNAFEMSTVGHMSPGQWKVYIQSSGQTNICRLISELC
jgi:hypothetical protein